jgi:hypothetical protein
VTQWRYFKVNYGGSDQKDIFRCPANDKKVYQQKLADVEVCLPNGEWLNSVRETLSKEATSGWFDEVQDEITEDEAQSLIKQWQTSGYTGRF